MRQQPVVQTDEINVRKLETLATVHRDESHRFAIRFFFLVLFFVERQVFEEGLNSIQRRDTKRLRVTEGGVEAFAL